MTRPMETTADSAHRYPAFDGLRGWLACSVILTHAIFLTSLDADSALWHNARRLGDFAVLVFVIMSGFVIAGLLLEKREKWLPFMVGRFFRIYPVYALGLTLSIVSVIALPSALAAASWTGTGALEAN